MSRVFPDLSRPIRRGLWLAFLARRSNCRDRFRLSAMDIGGCGPIPSGALVASWPEVSPSAQTGRYRTHQARADVSQNATKPRIKFTCGCAIGMTIKSIGFNSERREVCLKIAFLDDFDVACERADDIRKLREIRGAATFTEFETAQAGDGKYRSQTRKALWPQPPSRSSGARFREVIVRGAAILGCATKTTRSATTRIRQRRSAP